MLTYADVCWQDVLGSSEALEGDLINLPAIFATMPPKRPVRASFTRELASFTRELDAPLTKPLCCAN
jgi:hypothetical protein